MQTPKPYNAAILFVGGFTQHRRPTNGVYEAFDRTYRRVAAGDVHVSYYPWMVDPAEIADSLSTMYRQRLASRTDPGEPMRLAIVGYSFGGHTAVQICQHLKPGVRVEHLLLCDPVARWCGRLGWSRALLNSTIVVPEIVDEVTWLFQNNPRLRLRPPFVFPRSHDVKRESRSTYLRAIGPLKSEHVNIDNGQTFQGEVDLAVNALLAGRARRPASARLGATP